MSALVCSRHHRMRNDPAVGVIMISHSVGSEKEDDCEWILLTVESSYSGPPSSILRYMLMVVERLQGRQECSTSTRSFGISGTQPERNVKRKSSISLCLYVNSRDPDLQKVNSPNRFSFAKCTKQCRRLAI
jgi:hypothetical protein